MSSFPLAPPAPDSVILRVSTGDDGLLMVSEARPSSVAGSLVVAPVASPDGRGVVVDPEVLAVDGDAGFGTRTLGVLGGQVFLLHLGDGRHQAA